MKKNFNKMDLSAIDIKILGLLQQDASLTAAEIAEHVNLSVSPCWRRISRLEKEGIIEKKVALLNHEKLGIGMVIFARISLSQNDEATLHTFEERVRQYPEVVECYTVTGAADYFLKIMTRDIKRYDQFLRHHLLQIPHVRDVNSNVAVTQVKYSTGLPLETQLKT